MARGPKKGPGGGGDGGSVANLVLWGSDVSDSLRGGKGDDTFYGLAGNDTLDGGDGFDTAVFGGSVLDFSWEAGKRGKVSITDLNASDGDEGTDVLSNIEAMQFDDYTYYLDGRANGLVFRTADQYVVSVDASISITIDVYDLDRDYANYGDISVTGSAQVWYGERTVLDTSMGDAHRISYTIDPDFYADNIYFHGYVYDQLAQGETVTETITLSYTGFGVPASATTIELVIVGVNEAPTLLGDEVSASEDGAAVSLDLAELGADIDSDDEGSTLTYSILGMSEAANVWVSGTSLMFDPGDGYQNLNDGDVYDIVVTVQATDRHGAMSEARDVVIRISGKDDARPDYLNADFSVNYSALGITLADHADLVRMSGVEGDPAANLALAQFSDGDDVRVYKAEVIEIFGDYDFYYDYYGVDLYDDLTLDTGTGNDVLVFKQESAGELSYLGLTDIVTGAGEDVVVIDSSASGPSGFAWMEGVNVSTGEDNDQLLIRLDGRSGQAIEGGDFSLGGGNDYVFVQLNSTVEGVAGHSTIIMSDFYLGAGNDELIIDVNGKDAVWGHVKADVHAGTGDDHIVIDNSDTTIADGFGFSQRGFDGNIYLGGGDDVLDFNVSALPHERSEAVIVGGEGYDVLNLLSGGHEDFAIEAQPYPGYYTITAGGQEFWISGVEEINTLDGSLLDVLV